MGKPSYHITTDGKVRKLRDGEGLDTLTLLAVNDAD